MSLLTVIVPCYRNAENLPEAFAALLAMERGLPQGTTVEYVFVDDGSDDDTHTELTSLHAQHPDRTAVIRLTRNVGVYNALLAAFGHARGDCITVFPPDLQEPVELIPRMLACWRNGARLVLTVRQGRQDGLFTHVASRMFHGLMRSIALRGLPISGYGTGLLDRRVMMDLLAMNEKNSNTLLLATWLGYEPVLLPYARAKRAKGRSGWTLSKKIKLFIDSAVAFSYAPIRLITVGGLVFGSIAFVYAIVVIYSAVVGDVEIRGWSALMVVVLIAAAFQMIALGILGEYLWRTLDTVRGRPPYVVDELLDKRPWDPHRDQDSMVGHPHDKE